MKECVCDERLAIAIKEHLFHLDFIEKAVKW